MKIISNRIKAFTYKIAAILSKTKDCIRLLSIKLKNSFVQRLKSFPWKKIILVIKCLSYIGALITFIVNLYVNIFNTASQRYEEQYSRLTFRISNLINQVPNMTTQEIVKQISRIQATSLPIKPQAESLGSIIRSFNYKQEIPHEDLCSDTHSILRRMRDKLNNINISKVAFSPILEDDRGYDRYFSDFKNSNFEGSTLYESILINLTLSNSNFVKTQIHNSRLDYSSLISCELRESHITETRFFKAILDYSDMSGSNLWDNNFFFTSFVNTNLSSSLLNRNNFQFAILLGARLDKAEIYTPNDFQNALYNSRSLNGYNDCDSIAVFRDLLEQTFENEYLVEALNIVLHNIPQCDINPSQFSVGFDPKDHGMIDISEMIEFIQTYKKGELQKYKERKSDNYNEYYKKFRLQEKELEATLESSIKSNEKGFQRLLEKIKNTELKINKENSN